MTKKAGRRQFGSVRQLPSGRWQAHYTGPGDQRVLAPGTFARKADAEAWLTDRRREIDLSLWNPQATIRPQKKTFQAYSTAWLAARRTQGRPLKPRTVANYRYQLDRYLLPVWGQRELSISATPTGKSPSSSVSHVPSVAVAGSAISRRWVGMSWVSS